MEAMPGEGDAVTSGRRGCHDSSLLLEQLRMRFSDVSGIVANAPTFSELIRKRLPLNCDRAAAVLPREISAESGDE